MANLNTIFKAYDVRGRVPTELDEPTMRLIGMAFGHFLPPGRVAVGRDMRTESAQLSEGLLNGLLNQGRELIDLGQCSSDMMYYVVGSLHLAGGAMITASHNAAGYSGVKLTGPKVSSIGQDSGLEQIKKLCLNPRITSLGPAGTVEKVDLTKNFVRHAIDLAQKNFGPIKKLQLGYDAGNGMAAIFVPELEQQIDVIVKAINLSLDGSFPGHSPNLMDPKNLAALQMLVRAEKLDCGVAFDGDGDRAFFVDEKGQILSADILGALLIKHTLKRFAGATIVYSAISSRIVADAINAGGGRGVISRAGHSFIKAKMQQTNAILGVEQSGHFYFADNYSADSGLIAALSGLAVLSHADRPLSEIVSPFGRYFDSGEINFRLPDPAETATLFKRLWQRYDEGEVSEIDGLTIHYPDWWFNVRASNTEPVLRLNVEAVSEQLLGEKTRQLTTLIKST